MQVVILILLYLLTLLQKREDFHKHTAGCAEEYIDIKADAAVFHVVDIPLYAFPEFTLNAYFSNIIFYLGHAGHTG